MCDIYGEGGFETSWSTLLRVALVLLALVISTPGLAQFAGGDGSLENPWQIATPAQFDELRNYLGAGHADKHFVLTSDIDLWAYSDGAGWVPVGEESNRFSGHLGGDGHVIRNLVINRPEADYQGLFGYLDGALIRRLGVENVDLQGGHFTGGLAGRADDSTIESVHVTGDIRGGDDTGGMIGHLDGSNLHLTHVAATVEGHQRTGGLAGRVSTSSILRAHTLGSVTGADGYIGGLAGRIDSGSITDSYSRAGVSGSGGYIGGLAGYKAAAGTIQRAYTTGAVSGTGTYISVIVGRSDGAGTITESYCDLESSGQSSSSHCVDQGSTTAEMQQRETYRNWNFFTLWNIDEGSNYPIFQDLSAHAAPQAVDLNTLDGSGTESDPWIITSADELNAMRQDLSAHFRLGNDIDLAASVVWNGGESWEPIGDSADRFNGSLDGGGNAIRNLNISRSVTHQGLFGYLQDAAVKNLVLEGAHVWGGAYTGALAGYVAGSSTIDRVEVNGEIVGTHSYVGGLAGFITNNTLLRYGRFAGMVRMSMGGSVTGGLVGFAGGSARIAYAHTDGIVAGGESTGGLVGHQGNPAVTADSFSRAEVSGTTRVGGLIGRLGSPFTHSWLYVRRSYSSGSVVASGSLVGGLVGSNSGMGIVRDSFWNTETSGQTSSAGGDGRTTAQMQQFDTYRHWNFFTLWRIDEGNNYPLFQDLNAHPAPGNVDPGSLDGSGTAGDPWIISNADELNAIRQDLGAHYRLGNDIDLSASVAWNWNAGEGWEPIGDDVTPFTGSLDGDSHAIRKLTINRPESSYQGLFGYLGSDATVTDLVLENAYVRGHRYTGALAGYARGSIANLQVNGEIHGKNNYTGGLIGYLYWADGLSRSHAAVSVRGGPYTGGLVGRTDNSPIAKVYSLGTVLGNQYTGGLVGYQRWGTLADSYSRAEVAGPSNTGGLVGHLDQSSGRIERSYSAGAVAGSGGGLLGTLNNGTVADSYWDIETSGQTTSAGGEGKTTAEMQQQSTFVNWNFTSEPIWSIVESVTYPDLEQTPGAISLDLSGRMHANDASAGHAFAVLANTAWTATADDAWITVTDTTGGVQGDENGTVTYSIDANPSPDMRTGSITVSDGAGLARSFSIRQGALLDITPLVRNHDAGASSGHVIHVQGNVVWEAISDSGWLLVSDGAAGSGQGSVTYRITENPTVAPRSGAITLIGGGMVRTLVVNQAGALPHLDISPHFREHDAANSADHTIAVNGNIGWNAQANDTWLAIENSAGHGDGTVTYSVESNASTNDRLGTIMLAGGKRTFWFRAHQSAARSIGGTVTGLGGSGLVLQNNDGDDLGIVSDGNFTFETALPDGSEYNVTVLTQPMSPSQTCDVVNGYGVLDGEDVDDVQVDCTTDSFTVTTTATNGAITSPPNPIVEYGETTTVTGEADEHYYFASVSGCDGIEQSNSDQSVTGFSYKTGAIVADCAVEAVFAIRTYTIEATVVSGQGSVEVQTPIVEHGADATVEIIAATGWSVAEVIGDICIPTDSGDDIWTAADITQDCAIEVSFVEDTTIELQASMSPAIVGIPVTYTITVTGSASAPIQGQVHLSSNQAEPLCNWEAPDSTSGNVSSYHCEHIWIESGPYDLTATFGSSSTHGDGTDSRTENVVADDAVFRDRFE